MHRSHFGSCRCWTSAPQRLEPRWSTHPDQLVPKWLRSVRVASHFVCYSMTDGTSLATDGVLVRYPSWGCRCGIDGNFCSRGQCRNCGATAPALIRKLAIDEISKRKKQVKQNNGKSHAKGDAHANVQRQIADLQKKLHAGGNTEEENDKSKASKWTKGLPKWMRPESLSTGVSTSPSALEESASVSFARAQMHCEPRRIQPINSWLLRSLRWLMNTVPPSRKKCLWLDGPSSWTSRSRKRSVPCVRWWLRTEICIFKVASEHNQTGARWQNRAGPVSNRAFRSG